ncbi:hypothetical protein GGI43DRAFT_323984 [Trichoderma evansii]
MAHHHQYPASGSGPPQFEGEIFEMAADSVAPKTEPLPQANPWPFYLDQDVRTEARVEEEKGAGKTKVAEQPLANPWAYFGPMTPDEEKDEDDKGGRGTTAGTTVAGQSADGLGIKVEELKLEKQEDSKAKSEDMEDASLRPQPLHLGGDEAPPHDAPPPIPTVSPPPPPPAGTDYIAPLRLSRKQVPAFTVAPAFKPYLPPEESNNTTIAPLKVKHQRASSEGPPGDSSALPYRPYRPPGYVTPPGSKADGRVDVAGPAVMPVPRPASTSSTPASAPPPPSKDHDSLVTGPVAPQMAPPLKAPSRSASPNLAQQHQVVEPSGSMGAPLDGAAPHRLHSPPVTGGSQPPPAPTQAPPPAPASAPTPVVAPVAPTPPPPPAAAPPPPPAAVPPPPPTAPAPAPPVLGPVPTVAVAVTEPSAAAASIPHHASPPPVPQTAAIPSYHHSPSPSASSPALGYSLNPSPALGQQAYMSPHSAPTSAMPSPNMTTYPFQPIGQGQPQTLYPSSSPPPPTGSPGHPAPMYYPPAQQYTPPPPTSSYDIPQRTYASSADIPPPQPPRPSQYQTPSPGAYQQASPQSPSPYTFPDVQMPGTQPPYGPPSMYNMPYLPAVAAHQHQYPTQPTYATPSSEGPSSPNLQDPYAAPPLPPRPSTTTGWESQPQVLTGFTPHVVAYPPPPKRVFDPPPGAPGGPPRKSSGGLGMGLGMGMGSGKLFSSSSALKWIDKTGKGLENRLDSVLSSQGSSKPPPQPPRPN